MFNRIMRAALIESLAVVAMAWLIVTTHNRSHLAEAAPGAATTVGGWFQSPSPRVRLLNWRELLSTTQSDDAQRSAYVTAKLESSGKAISNALADHIDVMLRELLQPPRGRPRGAAR
jgi:hypothetical protein